MVSAWILTITQQWSLALISAACMGFAATYLGVSFQAEIQADLHDNIRGRVMSLWGMITIETGTRQAIEYFVLEPKNMHVGTMCATTHNKLNPQAR